MKLITAHSRPLLEAWWDAALNTPHVARFIGQDGWRDFTANPGDGWNRVTYLSDDGSALLSLTLERGLRTEAQVGLWCLHHERQRRAVRVGQMLHALPPVLRGLGVHAVNSIVHASNGESLALHRKRFGAPWGVKPDAAWDPMFTRYIDLYYFRKPLGP